MKRVVVSLNSVALAFLLIERVIGDTILGNVILIGSVGGQVDVNHDGIVDINADKDGQALVVSYSPDGDLRWFRGLGEDASAKGMAVVTGPNDEIYIGGWYRNGAPDLDDDGEPDLPFSDETSADVIALQDHGKFEMPENSWALQQKRYRPDWHRPSTPCPDPASCQP